MNRLKHTMEQMTLPEERKEKLRALYALQGKEAGQDEKRRILTPRTDIAAATLCAMAALMVSFFGGAFRLPFSTPLTVAQHAGETMSNTISEAANTLSHSFTLRVQAAETEGMVLTKDHPAPVVTGKSEDGWVLSGTEEDENIVNYCFSAPLVCEGEGIRSVTWSLNRGCFQVVSPREYTIVTDGEELFDVGDGYGQIGGDWETDYSPNDFETDINRTEFVSDVRYYRSFTLDYARQSDAHTWINLCGETSVPGYWDRILHPESDGAPYDIEADYKDTQKVIDGIVITCTVTYEDGAVESTQIVPGVTVLTQEEAGTYMPMNAADREEASKWYGVYVTYELL